jgi:SHAQKYF class myb-like DNA-binding protein
VKIQEKKETEVKKRGLFGVQTSRSKLFPSTTPYLPPLIAINNKIKRLFREAIDKFGKDYRKVQIHVGTRTIGQVRSHAQKYFQKQKSSGAHTTTPSTSKQSSQSNSASSSTTTGKHSPVATPSDTEANVSAAKSGSESEGSTLGSENSMNSNTKSSRGGTGKHLPSHNTPWTPEEQKAFTEGLAMYGKGNWKVISSHIGSRTPLQVKYLCLFFFFFFFFFGVCFVAYSVRLE